MTNFQVQCRPAISLKISRSHQVAGCTLDAGAKIYAGRVDAMYNDVYKMLGGLGRSNRTEQEGAEMSLLINTTTSHN